MVKPLVNIRAKGHTHVSFDSKSYTLDTKSHQEKESEPVISGKKILLEGFKQMKGVSNRDLSLS